MNASALLLIWEWLCEELVNALLRPVWRRYCAAGHRDRRGDRQETPQSERCYLRFLRLVDKADCWPCYVEFSRGGALYITPRANSDDGWGYDAEDFGA